MSSPLLLSNNWSFMLLSTSWERSVFRELLDFKTRPDWLDPVSLPFVVGLIFWCILLSTVLYCSVWWCSSKLFIVQLTRWLRVILCESICSAVTKLVDFFLTSRCRPHWLLFCPDTTTLAIFTVAARTGLPYLELHKILGVLAFVLKVAV